MKAKREFSIFHSHLDLAHQFWARILSPDAWAIDATCGNGQDTLKLAKLCAGVIGIDVQEEALAKTKELIYQENTLNAPISLFCQSHATFPDIAYTKPIQLIVYNLGYLPGGNKTKTTEVGSTLQSVEAALQLLQPQGAISITCYPGHAEGALEESALLQLCARLAPSLWCVTFHRFLNRKLSPSLLLIQKNNLYTEKT
jgi:SAM-dependent methyltransferase